MKLVMKRAGAGVPSADRIMLLRDTDGDGRADTRAVFLQGLNSPFGRVCEVVWCAATKVLSVRSSLQVTISFSEKFDSSYHPKCCLIPQKCLSTRQLRKLVRPALPAVLQDFAAAFLGTVPFPPRALFLTLKQSSAYSGLPVSYLKRLIQEGQLKAIQAGGYRISRKHLEQLSQ
jgi:hypothetical protein